MSSVISTRLRFTINGQALDKTMDARVTLLDLIREHLRLTGTKMGCNHGQCGACTVLVDGKRMLSCLKFAASVEGCAITTIEGIGAPDALHPIQEAFMRSDAFQCGFCTPGQIMSALEVVADATATTPEAIRELMSGNLCRCGAYGNIVSAIMDLRADATV